MFEYFTENARLIVTESKRIALENNSKSIFPNHLAYALVSSDNPALTEIFEKFEVNTDELLSKIKSTFVESKSSSSDASMSRYVSDILSNTLRETVSMNRKIVDVECMLLSLLKGAWPEELLVALTSAGLSTNELKKFIVNSNGSSDAREIARAAGHPAGSENDDMGISRKSKNKNDALKNFADNLTEQAKKGKFDPVIGRKKELNRILQILARRAKNNPILLGEPGIGKTAVVEGLAQLIATGDVPEMLKEVQLYSLDLTRVVAGARYRGDFEERMKQIMAEVEERPEVVLFIDEIHMMIGAGSSEGTMDAANILKPALSRGKARVIGATTSNEFKKYFEKDSALERRFQPIRMDEPSLSESVAILTGLRDNYEEHHRVSITDEAIEAAVVLSDRYLTERMLPDKAIDLMDEASARARLASYFNGSENLAEVSEIDLKIIEIAEDKRRSLELKDYELASKLVSEEKKLIEEKLTLQQQWETMSGSTNSLVITEKNIAELMSEISGVPLAKISEQESTKLLKMERELHKRVIGQNKAVKLLSRTIRRQRTGLQDPNRPIGSFIFAGPTGVGKTELAKALAEYLFDKKTAMISLDMSEYQDKHTVSRLFGAPPGYVGFEEGGQLTEAVRRNPFSVVLFDEIEKAHPDVFDSLLQILDEGRLTDAQGNVVNFKNTVIIMTTNLGTRELSKNSVGFDVLGSADNAEQEYSIIQSKVSEALKKHFRPEFLNRVDETVVFPNLSNSELLQIVDVFVGNLDTRLKQVDFELNVTTEARELLAIRGYDKAMGARPLRRLIQSEVETLISETILFNKDLKQIVVDVRGEKFTVNGLIHDELEEQIDSLETAEIEIEKINDTVSV